MALHPAAIRQVLKPFRVALTGGRSKMFITDAAERSKSDSILVSGEKRIKAPKKAPFAPRNRNRKCSTPQSNDSKPPPGLTTTGGFGECLNVPLSPPILVVNSGSSSLKFSLLNLETETVLASGTAERLGTDTADLKLVDLDGVKHEEVMPGADHRSSLLRVINILGNRRPFDVKAIGHRVVHVGGNFRQAVLVTESRVRSIEALADPDPPLNPPNLPD